MVLSRLMGKEGWNLGGGGELRVASGIFCFDLCVECTCWNGCGCSLRQSGEIIIVEDCFGRGGLFQ